MFYEIEKKYWGSKSLYQSHSRFISYTKVVGFFKLFYVEIIIKLLLMILY